MATPVLFWGGLWYTMSLYLGNEILLPGPFIVFERLLELLREYSFWEIVANSFLRIGVGLALGAISGLALGCISFCSRPMETVIHPMMVMIKATPLASITILLLVWIQSVNLSVLLVALVVSPLIYSSVIGGLAVADKNMLEVFDVFQTPSKNRWRLLYLPQIRAYLKPALSYALGFAWKAGISGEILAQPALTIGEEMYYAKLYLDMPSLFAYTLVVVLISLMTERLVAKWI